MQVTTTYLQTVATVIPVLFIASLMNPSLMNPSLMREYSKHRGRSRTLNRNIKNSCAALMCALVSLSMSKYADDLISGAKEMDAVGVVVIVLVMLTMGYCAFMTGSLVVYICNVVRLATEEYPHPDRLKSEENDLQRRLSLVHRQQRELGIDDSTD